jgi:hypothetical protein
VEPSLFLIEKLKSSVNPESWIMSMIFTTTVNQAIVIADGNQATVADSHRQDISRLKSD